MSGVSFTNGPAGLVQSTTACWLLATRTLQHARVAQQTAEVGTRRPTSERKGEREDLTEEGRDGARRSFKEGPGDASSAPLPACIHLQRPLTTLEIFATSWPVQTTD